MKIKWKEDMFLLASILRKTSYQKGKKTIPLSYLEGNIPEKNISGLW